MALDAEPLANPFLVGQYAPVPDELDTDDLPVTGALPRSLHGSYLRNGANPAFAPLGRYHVFDGDGMVHAMEVADGRARYRNRFVLSRGLQAERRAGHALFGGLSEFRLPPPELIDEAGIMKNTANTNVVRHAGRTLALMEAVPPTELTAELATVGEYDFDGALPGAMTAHPKEDPTTGELVFFGYSPFEPYLRYHVADAAGRLTTSVDIDLGRPVMMHDFAVSERRVAFFDLPAIFDLDAMMSGGVGIRWEPDAGARIGVLDRARPEAGVRWFEVDPFFVFHFLNAHDEVGPGGDVLVVEGCRSPRMNVAFGDEALSEPVRPLLHRWRIDLTAGRVTDEALDDRPGDFPRVNDTFAGTDVRYGYVAQARSWETEEVEFDGVVKHDLVAGTSASYSYGPDAYAGEAAFAPDPGRAGDEDGGWLLNLVQDRSGKSALVVVDAQGLEEVARVHLPRRVPSGFHGNWMAGGA